MTLKGRENIHPERESVSNIVISKVGTDVEESVKETTCKEDYWNSYSRSKPNEQSAQA